MLAKSGTFLLGALGLTVFWALSFSTANAAENPGAKQGASDIQVWTRESETIERPYDPVKAKNLQNFAYKIFEPPFAIRCGNFDTKQIIARFGGMEKGVRLRRQHAGDDDSVFSRPQIVGVWAYPELSIEVWAEFLLGGITTRLRTITITSPDYPLQHGLRVGLPLSKFIETFGEPSPYKQKKTKEGREVRYCSHFMNVKLTADQQDRVTEIHLRCGEFCTR